jgi:Phospholipid methyltransferase
MGSRTKHLPPLTGIAALFRELRYHEASRQILGIVLIPLYALLAQPVSGLFAAGAVAAVAGTLVRLYASGFIVKNKELATDGPYSLVRHPLYTGNLLMVIGFTAASGLWWALLLSLGFWWFYYPPAIDYEDRKLRQIFGERCSNWQQSVPAVIPRALWPTRGGSWSLRTSLSRNLEPLIVVYSFFWLGWIYRLL